MFKKNCVLKFYLFLTSLIIFIFSYEVKAQNCAVNAGISSTFCVNEVVQLSGTSSGLFTEIASWSQVGGPSVIITDPTDLNTTVTGYIGGQTYTFRISATCEDANFIFNEVVITVNPVSDADAGADLQSCPGLGVINLNANDAGSNETGAWSLISNDGGVGGLSVSDPNSSLNLSSDNAGVSVLRWSISNSNGCSSSDDISITNYGGVIPVSAGTDQNLSNCYATTQSTNLSGSYAGDGTGGQQGTWSLVSGPNYPTIANINDANSSISNLVEGVYVFRWSVSGPCINSSDEVSITVPEAAQNVTSASSPDLRFCYGTSSAILVGSTPQYANEVVSWSQNAGPAGVTISDPNSSTTSISGLNGSSTYRFSYTITNTLTGCSTADNFVNIRFTSPPSIDTGPDQVLNCGTNIVTISPVVSGGTNTRYKIISGPITSPGWINDNNSNVIINNLNQEGIYSIQFERYSAGSGCTSAFDLINVNVSSPPSQANAGSDQFLACGVLETNLAGNIPATGTGLWSQVSGPNNAIITNPSDESAHISNLIEGEYIFRWTISGGNQCTVAQDEVSVFVSENAPIASAGSDRSVCHSSEIILEGNIPNSGASGNWSVSPGSGISFSNINDPASSVFGMQANTAYTFTWTISNQCLVESDNVIITTGSITGPGLANAGADQCLSTGTSSIILDGNIPTTGEGLWTHLSGPNNPVIEENTLQNTNVTGLIDGHYLFEWSVNVPGCETTRDTLMVSIVSAVSTSNAGADESICGSSVVLAANSPGTYELGSWEQVSGNSGYIISNANASNATLSNLLPGKYEFSWTLEKGACPSSIDNLIITVSEPPDIAVAAADFTVCSANSATLIANDPIVGNGVWSLVGGSTNSPTIISYNSPTTTVNNLASGTYQFRWTITSDSDCFEQTDDVIIQVSAPAVADPDRNLCNVTASFLEGTEGSDGTWTLSPLNTGAPAPTIANNSFHTADVTGMALDQSYIFRYTIPLIFGCGSTFDDLTINTSAYGSDPDAGPDQEICTTGGNSVIMAANNPASGTGSWNQLSGPNSANIVNPGLNTTEINNLIAGIYIFEWNIDYNFCGNYSDVVKIIVNEPPTLSDAGTDQINACQLDAQLAGNLPAVGIGTWTLFSAPSLNAASNVIIDNPNLPNSTISNISDLGNYEFTWTTTNGSVCASNATNVIVTFTADPPSVPNAGIDQFLCDANSFTLAGNDPGIGTGTWSQISGPVGALITNPGIYNTSVTNTISGTYQFQWEINNGGCTFSDIVNFVNSAIPPIANASLTDQEICEFNTLLLVGNDPGPGNGSWSFVSGPTVPLIISPSNQNSNVTGATAGAYTFKWTVSNGACPITEDNITVDIINNPATNLIVSGDEVCSGSDALITISSSENLIDYSLYISSNLVASATGNGSNIDILVGNSWLNIGSNKVDFIANNSGCIQNLINDANIDVKASPDETLIISGSTICNNADGTITISTSENGIDYEVFAGNQSVSIGTGDGNNLIMNVLSADLSIGADTFQIVATNAGTGCFVNMDSQAIITVNANPDLTLGMNANPTCDGSNGLVTILNSESGTSYEAFIGANAVASATGNGTNLDISISSSDLVLGNNIIEVLATTSANCANYLNNQAVILVNANPLINLTINNSEICNGDTAVIVIENSEEEIKYELFIDLELVAEGLGNGSILGIKVPFGKYSTGINQATVLATNILTACSLEMDTHPDIIVEACKIVVYDGFSPNDDGINETFVIEGLINYPNHKLTIFNRWGNKVYEASPYNNDWDGTNLFGLTVGGKKLPAGTYFYIIELGNGEKPLKGYIYINR